ncbi:hypothetical protein AN958_05156 [Leucoagaricus sp. SymC.cos]|nr:hypothetical protein AN958_05156 [Leucoagaricus sp. SymC.cos]
MLAKPFYNHPAVYIGTLPDELLCEVFRYATSMPYGIESSDLVLKRMQSSEAVRIQREYGESLVTKRNLIRVCKRWYYAAFAYLYEWILVSLVQNIEGIVKVVERCPPDNPGYSPVGRIVKRLDIDFRWTGRERADQLKHMVSDLLPRLLQTLVELEVLVIGDCFRSEWLRPAFCQSLCPKIRYLSWTLDSQGMARMHPNLGHWVDFLQSHPNLIGINPPLQMILDRALPTEFVCRQILTLTTTPAGHYMRIPNTFPSLRRLNIIFVHPRPDERWGEMLIPQPLLYLETLQLNFDYDFVSRNDTTLHTTQPVYRFIPNLRCVELVLRSWTIPRTWSRYAPPVRVSVLGIRVRSTEPNKQIIRLLQILRDIVQNAPRLTIQFLDEENFATVVKEKDHLALCAQEGEIIDRWLDPEGQLYKLLPVEQS